MVHARRSAIFCLVIVFLGVFISYGDSLPKLRVSLPPVMGALPIAFASGWNLFQQNGIDVDVIGLSDNQARALALMAGNIDGMVCDVTTALLLIASGTDIVITSTAYKPEQTGSLALLSQSYFNINSIDALLARTDSGSTLKSIAITEMSDIEYEIDALLTKLGYTVKPDKDYSYWHDMLQLATFLSLGSVYAAVLPEPYITYISNYPPVKPGTRLIHLSDFDGIDLLPSVVVFRRSIVEKSPDVIARFYDTYRQAIEKIDNTSREELIDTGIDEALALFFPGLGTDAIPEGVVDSFVIPHFSHPAMLSKQQYEDVVAWANAKHYTWKHPAYEDVTTDQFLK
jgi:NitT/TauT family transport system substrate-binding protein